MKDVKKTRDYKYIYNKYFKYYKLVARRVNSGYHSTNSSKISIYDDYIKKYSKEIDWDWRLLASLINQESKFDKNIKSWAGAYGLMQLMPTTALKYNVSEASTPEQHIEAGVEYLKWIDTNANLFYYNSFSTKSTVTYEKLCNTEDGYSLINSTNTTYAIEIILP
jgi:membrane-bound lytic murein transglycosylase F